MSLNLTVFQRSPGSHEMWQGQEGCKVIASVITVTVCNTALTVYLISSLSFKSCFIIACALLLFFNSLTFKNRDAVETERIRCGRSKV